MRISPEQWEAVKALFDAALELKTPEREAFLCAKSADDSVRAEAQRLLAEYEEAGSFLSSPALAAIPLQPKRKPKRFSEGEILGERFRILRFVAEGGMGEVYEAEDLELHEFVAIKTLRPETLLNIDALARFKREVHLARKVTHPSVCRIFDLYRHKSEEREEVVILSMEFLRGETLAERIKRQGRMSIEEALPLIRQMAYALGAAHEAGIAHRDFKPSNVILVPEPAGIRAVVTDFGLAFQETTNSSQHTLSGPSWHSPAPGEDRQVYGTPAYMAPEQIEGHPATIASDIYAFGLVIYEMVTGVRPFQGDTPISTAVKRLVEAPPPPRKFAPNLSSLCESAILQCLEREPANRFAKAQDVSAAMEQSGKSISAEDNRFSLQKKDLLDLRAVIPIIILAFVSVAALLVWLGKRGRQTIAPTHAEYTQLTNFADSAFSPALSPDGRMLAFIRSESTQLLGTGELYVELLPNGEPVQLTHNGRPKSFPRFSPDGSRIAFTMAEGWDWQTWTIPVLGGEPSELLPNASALTWIAPHQVMFSTMNDQVMKIVTTTESRSEERDIYRPPNGGMAHSSHVSADSKWVLIAEMDEHGWLPCRVVPFGGGAQGKQVGPIPSKCIDSAWSPDSQWMYFSADRGDGFHLWRQAFPDGAAEQITFSGTEEQGVAVSQDGKSVATSVGSQGSTVWLRQQSGEKQVSAETFAYLPSFSPDGKKLYYLARIGTAFGFVSTSSAGELWSVELDTGQKERLLPGVVINDFAVSPDGKQIAFQRTDAPSQFGIWLWSLDRSSAPRLVASDARHPLFSRAADVFFERWNGQRVHVFRVKANETVPQRVAADGADHLITVSPDARWIIASIDAGDLKMPGSVVAFPAEGGPAKLLCKRCLTWGVDVHPPIIAWSSDQKFVYVSFRSHTGPVDKSLVGKTLAIPLRPGEAFPWFSGEFINNPELARIAGSYLIQGDDVAPGPNASTYAFLRFHAQCNIYRIALR